jgi:hypothetical protein
LQAALIKDINKKDSSKVKKDDVYYTIFFISAKPLIKDFITLKQVLTSNNIEK